MPQHLISVDPDPPQQGEDVRVCYNFDAITGDSVSLRITFDPGGTETVTVTRAERCVTVSVPQEAGVYLIEDLSRQSYDKGGPVAAP